MISGSVFHASDESACVGSFAHFANTDAAFNDVNLSSRDGVGIPEPASLSLLALGGIGVLVRRKQIRKETK